MCLGVKNNAKKRISVTSGNLLKTHIVFPHLLATFKGYPRPHSLHLQQFLTLLIWFVPENTPVQLIGNRVRFTSRRATVIPGPVQ